MRGVEMDDAVLGNVLRGIYSQHDELNRLGDVSAVLDRGIGPDRSADDRGFKYVAERGDDRQWSAAVREEKMSPSDINMIKGDAVVETSQGLTLEQAEFAAEQRRYAARVSHSLEALEGTIQSLKYVVEQLASQELRRAMKRKAKLMPASKAGKSSNAKLAQGARAARNMSARVRSR